MTIRPPASASSEPPSLRPVPSEFLLRPAAADETDSLPELSIRPSGLKVEAEESGGALNLSKGSEGWSPPPPAVRSASSEGVLRPSPPRSPQGYRPPTYTSLEICVVCGDRASGIN